MTAEAIILDAARIDAVLFDLDGVVTDTARRHVEAWKATFDDYLAEREGPEYQPFDPVLDYQQFVDGRLRQDGIEQFLQSRGISLELGSAADLPGWDTIWAIGNRKDQQFRKILATKGVEVYPDARSLIQRLRQAGIATGLVTASRNGRRVLETSGLSDLFDAIIDGNDVARLGLPGKPAPDMFLEAARALATPPSRSVVVEDSTAGIEAARAGGFHLSIRVLRHDRLREASVAANVVTNLDQVHVAPRVSALQELDNIARRVRDGPHAILLDYDGTLTPIVSRPEEAVLSMDMREILSRLAQRCPVGIVTGRSLSDIQRIVGIDLPFIASHGLELRLPGQTAQSNADPELSRDIARIGDVLEAELGSIPGVIIERKPFSIAVHYRLAPENRLPDISQAIEHETKGRRALRLLTGKKVIEVRPDSDWDKGEAVLALSRAMGIRPEAIIYIGDDVTDEDAFRVLRDRGITIAVLDTMQPTAARYVLHDVGEVQAFLEGLLHRLEDDETR